MRIGRAKPERDVFYISDAPKPLSQDIRSRESKYLMAMGIRVVAQLVAGDVAASGPLDLQHVRTEPGEQLGARRAGLDTGEVDDLDAGERSLFL